MAFVLIFATGFLTVGAKSANQELSDVTEKLNQLETNVSRKQADLASLAEEKDTLEKQVASLTAAVNAKNTNSKGGSATPTGPKVAYLTFDDGPTEITPRILSVLKEYDIKATFFVIGSGNVQYMKDIVDQGHAIAVHSYTHDYGKIYKSTAAFWEDFNKMHDLIKDATGVDTKICRFPGGSSNTVSRKYSKGIMTTLVSEMNSKGYAYFDWNVDSTDASGTTVAKDKLVQSVKNQSSNGGIHTINVLMHDAAAKSTTADALPEIIDFLKSKDYTFKSLDASSPVSHHGVNN